MKRPNQEQWKEMCLDITQIGKLLAAAGYNVVELDQGHGYSRSSRPEAHSKGGHGDPTGETAIHYDPMANASTELVRQLNALRVVARNALAAMNRGLALTTEPIRTEQDSTKTLPICVNRYCNDEAAINAKTGRTTHDGRCVACYGYRRRHDGEDAGPIVIDRRLEARTEEAA